MDEHKLHLVRLEERQVAFDTRFLEMLERFEKHMEHEETAFNKLYERLRALDASLIASFKERDTATKKLEINQVKLLAWATGAFSAVMAVFEIAVKVVF